MITVQAQITPGPLEIGSQQLTVEEIAKSRLLTAMSPNYCALILTYSSLNHRVIVRDPGELALDVVFFHGGKFYNNNYMIDGFSNNDRLNPSMNVGYVARQQKATPRPIFPLVIRNDTRLIESLSVYDSNISAKYGQFTGCVVDAKLKNHPLQRSILFYRLSWYTLVEAARSGEQGKIVRCGGSEKYAL
ncbi:MAG: hypothetical protein ACR5LD_10140 [Symbiopectobacterium sp.]